MDTYEARRRIRSLADRAATIVQRQIDGVGVEADDAETVRRLVEEGRSLLSDSGYPGERAWSGLSRAALGFSTSLGSTDPMFWTDVRDELRGAVESLDGLIGPDAGRDVHIRIIT